MYKKIFQPQWSPKNCTLKQQDTVFLLYRQGNSSNTINTICYWVFRDTGTCPKVYDHVTYLSVKMSRFYTLFFFIFKLYIIVLVLPNIKMNPPHILSLTYHTFRNLFLWNGCVYIQNFSYMDSIFKEKKINKIVK